METKSITDKDLLIHFITLLMTECELDMGEVEIRVTQVMAAMKAEFKSQLEVIKKFDFDCESFEYWMQNNQLPLPAEGEVSEFFFDKINHCGINLSCVEAWVNTCINFKTK